ncbi:hypothetical protein GCM10010371_55840 [Streptomyces subrutilus]|uniref:Uncharacterized protein n=1 Tax=Streptomyces subrutilus TaxID=36818 RepID=A0A5P2US31_9ACTN|nr:hypothetical protein [Streptomyces subrutilus]QEU82146.1 hypothetical protein CP968_31195 [Streptomyces subrutilus]GGZ88829.1 hypothetical protein GCM10010371_55840 [Streptomyces subrutilus]
MTPRPAARIHLMITFVLVSCGTVAGACLGLLLSGRSTALLLAGVAGLGAGAGALSSRRHVLTLLRPDPGRAPAPGPRPSRAAAAARGDGYAEGLADGVLVCVATYRAAVFPLTPDGVSGQERRARRDLAYRVAAHDGLPHPVQVSAAAALEAIDQGLDAERAEAAMRDLGLTVFGSRRGR